MIEKGHRITRAPSFDWLYVYFDGIIAIMPSMTRIRESIRSGQKTPPSNGGTRVAVNLIL